jgi:hypothetical protein
MTDSLHANRRARVAIQVFSRWKGHDDPTDDDLAAVERAADVAFRRDINDLDWEDATLRLLDDGTAS